MPKEAIESLKVGDRLTDGSLVVDTRHLKQGAIGIIRDLPEHQEATRKALKAFAAAVRDNQVRPRFDRPRPEFFDEPLDGNSLN